MCCAQLKGEGKGKGETHQNITALETLSVENLAMVRAKFTAVLLNLIVRFGLICVCFPIFGSTMCVFWAQPTKARDIVVDIGCHMAPNYFLNPPTLYFPVSFGPISLLELGLGRPSCTRQD